MNFKNLRQYVTDENKNKAIIAQPFYPLIKKEYMNVCSRLFESFNTAEGIGSLISEINFKSNAKKSSVFSENVKMDLSAGDVCLIDFGKQYTYECSYVHLGLVIGFSQKKLFVVPMTSNKKTLGKAEEQTSDHLAVLLESDLAEGHIDKNSVLFLNDARFINSARIIEKVGHIDADKLADISKCLADKIVGKMVKGERNYGR